jgi:hypothetical protein
MTTHQTTQQSITGRDAYIMSEALVYYYVRGVGLCHWTYTKLATNKNDPY